MQIYPLPSPTTVVFIGQTSENRSTQEKDINISFMQQEKIKKITSNIKKKNRYRYILPCQVYFCPTVQSCRVKHYNISVLFFILKTRFTEKCSAINIYTLKKRFLHDFSNIQLPISCATTTSPKRAGKDSWFSFFLQDTKGDKSVFSCSAQTNVAIHLLLTTAAARCITWRRWRRGGVGWGGGRWNVNASKNHLLIF